MMQANPELRQRVEATMRQLQGNPALAQQMMGGLGGAGGAPGGMPDPAQLAQLQQLLGGGGMPGAAGGGAPAGGAPANVNEAGEAMSEEEAIQEAIRRSMRDQSGPGP